MGSQAQRIGDALRKHTARVSTMLVLELDKELRKATPVDTGHARRNWVPSVDEPNTTVATSDAARAAGISSVLAYDLSKGALWVANVVPYIRRLNYGHSQQAPAGFVERAIDLAMQTVRSKGGDVSGLQREFRDQVGSDGAENLASAYSPFSGED